MAWLRASDRLRTGRPDAVVLSGGKKAPRHVPSVGLLAIVKTSSKTKGPENVRP
jgi:hypothetical protein